MGLLGLRSFLSPLSLKFNVNLNPGLYFYAPYLFIILKVDMSVSNLVIAQLAERWTVEERKHPSVAGSIPAREIYCFCAHYSFFSERTTLAVMFARLPLRQRVDYIFKATLQQIM